MNETPGGTSVLRQVAGQVQELARREADNGPGLDGDYLRRQGQAHFNQFLQGGVQAARDSDLPFLRHLQGDLRYDFDRGRASLELRTIDEIYRQGPHTGLLQLGAHNQNERPTANVGAIYRREVLDGLLLGANAFVDYEFGKQHGRGSLGWEAIAPRFSLHANIYFPLSAWKGAKRDGRREERPASGMDVGLKFSPAFVHGLEIKASHFRWNGAGIDYFDNGRPQNRAAGFKYGVQYKPVPLLSLGLEQDKVMGGGRQTRLQLGLSINLSEPLSKQLRRDTPAPGFSPSLTALVERENRIVLNTRRKQIILPLSITQVSTHQVDGRLTVIGQTQPRATVTIRMPDGVPGSATADASGRYAFTSRGDQPSGNLVLRARNAEGDSSREVTYHYVDEVPLGDLLVEVVALLPQPADRALEVRGVTEPMADVRVSFPNGESVGVTADDKGHFRARSKRQVEQGQVTVQAVDPRTLKEARAALPYLPPAAIAPVTEEIVTHPDTGQVTLTGTAEPGVEVRVSFPDGTGQTVKVGPTGSFTVTSERDVPSGMITLLSTDTVGNQSPEVRHEYVDTVDKTAPAAPADMTVSTDTSSGRVTVTGSTEPQAHVTVTFPDGSSKRVQADADGRYTVTSDADMPSGTINTRVTDAAGNTGPEARLEYVDTVDKTAPAAPADMTVSTDTSSGRVTVTGSTEPQAHVTVTFPDGSSKQVQADADGRYTVTSDADMPSGTINTQVTDAAGNTGPEARHEYVDTVDKTAPAAPGDMTVLTDTSSGRVTVTGSTEPQAHVTVIFPDGSSKQVQADADGRYTVTSDTDMPSGTINTRVTDAAGNTGPEARLEYVDTVDKTAPAAPADMTVSTDTSSGRVTVTGSTEPQAHVTVTFPDGSSKRVQADAEGRYTVTSDADMPSGTINTRVTDAAGNTGPEARLEYVDTVDKTAPSAPADMTVSTDTSSGRVTVTGSTEPQAHVTVTFPDGSSKRVQADADGRYTVTSDADMPSGTINTRVTDAAGNTGPEVRHEYVDTVDKTPPAAPQASKVTTDSVSGRVTVSGTAEPGAEVRVSFPDGTDQAVKVGAAGSYTVTSERDVPSGVITVQATDPAGNRSPETSHAYDDVVDKTPPDAPADTEVTTDPTSGWVTVSGTAEPGADVTVVFPDGTSKTVRAGATGSYTVVSDGDMPSGVIKIQATDAAGNSSPEVISTYTDLVDKTPPLAPTVADVATDEASGRVTVSGTAEPGAAVTVVLPDGTSKTVRVDTAGSYTVVSDGDMPSGVIKIQATDAAGNSSPEVISTYTDLVDKTPPLAPTVAEVVTDKASGRVTVSGMAEPGAEVRVSFPDGTDQVVKVGAGGSYTVTSERDVPSGVITVQTTDPAGNRSPETSHAYDDMVDKTPPDAPADTEVTTDPTSGRVTVSGAAEPGADVTVVFPDGTSKTVKADATGSYNVVSDGDMPSGMIKIRATDAAGNDSPEVTSTYIDLVDKTPPLAPTVAEVATDKASGRVTVSGAAEPGAVVTVVFPDGTSKTVKVDTAGSYTVASDGDMPSGMIKIRATDAAGNDSPEVTSTYADVVDKTPPLAPTVAEVATDEASGWVTVSGTAEPEAHVTVVFPDGTSKTVKAGAAGSYAVVSDADMPSGSITIQATDAAGNSSPEVISSYTDRVDKTPPPAPTVADVVTDEVSGRVTVSGAAEPDADVTVVFPDGTSKTVKASTAGSYTVISDSDMSSGSITIRATDAAGNSSSEVMRTYTDLVDKTPPPAPTVADVATDETSGQVTLTGTAEPAAQVMVRFPDGTGKTVVAGADGAYSVTSEGDMVAGDITVTATDASGNKGPQVSKAYVDTVDKTPPPLAITAVTENLDTGQVTVSGKSEPGSRVTVTFSDSSHKTVVTGDDGAYTATSDGDLPSGSIQVRAMDEAGNASAEERREYIDTVDKTAPEEPLITTVTTNATSGQLTVTGTAEPGADVTVTFPDNTSKTVKADTEGVYTATSDKDVPSGTVMVQATDAAGNEGEEIVKLYRDERKALSIDHLFSVLAEQGQFRPIEISREGSSLNAYFDVIGVGKPLVRIEPVDPADANARKLIDLLQVQLYGWRRNPKSGSVYLEKLAGTGPDGTVPPGDYAIKMIFTDPGIPEAQVVIPGVIRWS